MVVVHRLIGYPVNPDQQRTKCLPLKTQFTFKYYNFMCFSEIPNFSIDRQFPPFLLKHIE